MVGAMLVAAAASAWAQQPQPDARWQAWLGCWKAVNGAAADPTGKTPVVCVIPAGGGVDVATVVDTQIVARDHIEVLAERQPVTRAGCTGWETASWSSEGERLYRRSEYSCPGDVKRTTTELIAMSPSWEWIDVQGLEAHGGTGVRVLRYRSAAVPAVEEIVTVLQARSADISLARGGAAAPPNTSDVVEASRAVDPAVVEAWLAEEGEGFPLTGKQLVALADSGVSSRVIDVMVAMTYPRVFAVSAPSAQGEFSPVDASRRVPPPDTSYGYRPASYYPTPYYGACGLYGWDYWSPWSWSSCGYYSPFGYAPYGPYRYGGWYGGGYYGGGTIFIVPTGGGGGGGGGGAGGPTQPHGRIVNGRGYTRGGAGSTAQPQTRVSGNSDSRRSSGGSGSSAPPPSSAGSGSSSQAGQKAHPRP
jgi:hypothetical protein